MEKETILHYKILEKLGEGGMGVVYLAEDTKLKRQVAIKFLPQSISDNSEEKKRFEIEAQAAAALNHPNISTIHNIEEADDEIEEAVDPKQYDDFDFDSLNYASDYTQFLKKGVPVEGAKAAGATTDENRGPGVSPSHRGPGPRRRPTPR